MYARLIYLLAAIPFGIGASLSANGTTLGARFNKLYGLSEYHSGNDIVNNWYYFVGPDPTNGNVYYVDQATALNEGLAYVDGNTFAAVFGIDSWSSIASGGTRNSVRITSPSTYTGGLFILDATTMPVGCGVWPAFWTTGPNWPASGEIDIVEGVNDQSYNQMTLHTGANTCSTSTGSPASGSVLNTDCYSTTTSNAGCAFQDNDPNSFANGFNSIGGGVYALEWDSTQIQIWFFERSSIPSDITAQTPNPANWGTPAAYWDTSTCDIANDFYDHSMIFDVTICGDWAGSAYGSSGCPGTCSDIVSNTGNFAAATWVVNYVAVYQ